MKKIIGIAILALAIAAGTAHAAERSMSVWFNRGPLRGSFQINQQTCRFLRHEVDLPLGKSWLMGRVEFAYEDQRHDVLMGCNRARTDRIVACILAVPPITEHVDHPSTGMADEKGAAASLAALKACIRQAA